MSVCVCGGRRRSHGSPGADVPSHVAVTEATVSAPWGPLPSPPVPGPGSLTLRRSCPSAPLCPSAARHPRGPDSCRPRGCARRGLPSPQRPCSRCNPAPGGPSPRTWGSSHLALAASAPSAPGSLLPSSRSPTFLRTPGLRPRHQPPVLRLLKLGYQLGGKKNNLPD